MVSVDANVDKGCGVRGLVGGAGVVISPFQMILPLWESGFRHELAEISIRFERRSTYTLERLPKLQDTVGLGKILWVRGSDDSVERFVLTREPV